MDVNHETNGLPTADVTVPSSIMDWSRLPGAAALLAGARKKVESGKTGGRSVLPVAPEHRTDVGRMLGLNWEATDDPVKLGLLRAKLADAGVDLDALLVAVGGPLRNRPAENRQAAETRQQVRADASDLLTQAGIPRPVADHAVGNRWLGTDRLPVARAVATAWRMMPHPPGLPATRIGTIGLAELAGKELGDPHALDRDRATGRAAARILAATLAYLDNNGDDNIRGDNHRADDQDDPTGSGRVAAAVAAAKGALRARPWRAAWERAGVLCDQVSSTVLVLNLPLEGPNPNLAHITGVAGEPVWITARLTRDGCRLPPALRHELTVVRVFENPSVIEAAADRLGVYSPPLVCLYGRPSTAAWAVLAAIAASGSRMLLSTDRDGAGKQIAGEIVTEIKQGFGPGMVAPWLPGEDGTYEEERLDAMLADMSPRP
ncbi:TIGR02679 domain-containing protein [Promicromonospora sp. NPDC057138]|uniref:TIGR02679 domain-containing protein n=1 Tax=Promicromonospora sp. NPDC057138 TaxID=3346031 RepID=UPI0036294A31